MPSRTSDGTDDACDGRLNLTVALLSGPRRHRIPLGCCRHRPPIRRDPAPTPIVQRHGAIAGDRDIQNSRGTTQVVFRVGQRGAGACPACIAACGGRIDLQQSKPSIAATDGIRAVCTFIICQGRHHADPERLTQMRWVRRVSGTPGFDIARHDGGERRSIRTDRRHRGTCPKCALAPVIPLGSRQERHPRFRAKSRSGLHLDGIPQYVVGTRHWSEPGQSWQRLEYVCTCRSSCNLCAGGQRQAKKGGEYPPKESLGREHAADNARSPPPWASAKNCTKTDSYDRHFILGNFPPGVMRDPADGAGAFQSGSPA